MLNYFNAPILFLLLLQLDTELLLIKDFLPRTRSTSGGKVIGVGVHISVLPTYVGLARAVSPTNTNFRLTFLLTRLQEALYEDLAV